MTLSSFWQDVASGFLGNLLAGLLLVSFYVTIQWFLGATDITIGYSWRFDGTPDNPRNIRPSFDIRNRSRSKSYRLANIAYLRNKLPIASFDNHSLWGKILEPGSIEFCDGNPVNKFESLQQALDVEVHVRLQNGREFWLKGSGPGQLRMGGLQTLAFWLRNKFESAAVPLE